MTTAQEPPEGGLQVQRHLRVLRESKWLILVCVLITLGAAAFVTSNATKKYAATARIVVDDEDVNRTTLGLPNAVQDPDVRAATDLDIAQLPVIAQRTARKLDLPYGADGVLSRLNTKSKANSRLISMAVTDEIPRRAARVANVFAAEYVAFRRAATREIYTSALARVRRKQAQLSRLLRGRSPTNAERSQARRLRTQANELDLLASVQTGGAQLVQRARVPNSPVSPKPSRNYALGAFIGLLLGFLLASLRDRLDRRIKSSEQLRELAPEFPILAELPRTNGSDKAAPFYAEGIRTLQTNLTFLNHDGSLKSLLVTSPSVGEGKSTTSLNLALAIAEQGEDDVVLVDGDLRRPGLSDALKLSRRMGVSNFLSGHGGTVQDYVYRVTVDQASINGKGPAAALSGSLQVVPAGPTPPNPHALLNASTLEAFMAQARTYADRVVIDGAPLGPTSDMLPVAKRVDGVVLLVRLYSSRRDELERLLGQLRQAGVQPLGIVLAGSTPRKRDAYYARQ